MEAMSPVRFIVIWLGVIITAIALVSLVYWDGTTLQAARIDATHREMESWWQWVLRVRTSDGLFLLVTVVGLIIALRWAPRGPGDRISAAMQQLLDEGAWPDAWEGEEADDDTRLDVRGRNGSTA